MGPWLGEGQVGLQPILVTHALTTALTQILVVCAASFVICRHQYYGCAPKIPVFLSAESYMHGQSVQQLVNLNTIEHKLFMH